MGAPDSNWEGEGWRSGSVFSTGSGRQEDWGTQHRELGAHQCIAVHQELGGRGGEGR